MSGTLRQSDFGDWESAPLFNLTDGATVTWNPVVNPVGKIILGGNRSIIVPALLTVAPAILSAAIAILFVVQDATGSRIPTFSANFKWPGGTAPTFSTAANAIDILSFVSDGTYLYGAAQLAFA